MEEKVVDRRVRKTKRQLRLALMKLMSEKSVKDISVRELAAIADINRSQRTNGLDRILIGRELTVQALRSLKRTFNKRGDILILQMLKLHDATT